MKKRVLLILVVLITVCATAIGGTVAWLADRAVVTNTFTFGEVAISLKETTGKIYQLLPGATLKKDPKVIIQNGSQDCWVFVKIEKTTGFDNYVLYALADGWLEIEDGVYYRSYSSASGEISYSILSEDKVTVKDTLTEADASILKESGSYPEIKFTAYAIQRLGIDSAEAAWEQIKNT